MHVYFILLFVNQRVYIVINITLYIFPMQFPVTFVLSGSINYSIIQCILYTVCCKGHEIAVICSELNSLYPCTHSLCIAHYTVHRASMYGVFSTHLHSCLKPVDPCSLSCLYVHVGICNYVTCIHMYLCIMCAYICIHVVVSMYVHVCVLCVSFSMYWL